MTRYLIKVTYTEGEYTGKTYLYTKGGYVAWEHSIQWEDTTYATYKIAKSVCTRWYNENEKKKERDEIENKRRIAEGLKPHATYLSKTYEPYAVEV